jgi:hypothetical protein
MPVQLTDPVTVNTEIITVFSHKSLGTGLNLASNAIN